VSSGVPGIFYIFFSAKLERASSKGIKGVSDIRFSAKVRGGSRVVAVFLFEVFEPFFSLRLHPNTSLRQGGSQ
jgi:hypothetical protein